VNAEIVDAPKRLRAEFAISTALAIMLVLLVPYMKI
jgi:hypothetical protein